MQQLEGIKYTNDASGHKRYVRIDLEKYGNNHLLEDLLDGLEATNCQGKETVSLEEFNRYIDERLKANV